MPLIRELSVKKICHIGHLDEKKADRRPTLDGPGLTVSTCPEVWRRILKTNGPEYRLEHSAAVWVDAFTLVEDGGMELQDWMLMRDYMDVVTVWTVSVFDADRNDILDFSCLNRADAAAKVGRTLEEEIAAEAKGQGAAMEMEGFRLSKRAMARLGGVSRWPDPLRWFDAAVLLYVREIVMPKRPLIVGVWWSHPLDEKTGTAPYGVLFPEQAHLFEVEDDEGNVRGFAEMFPGFEGLVTP